MSDDSTAAAPPHDDANGADEIEERVALLALLKSLEIDIETMWHAPAKTVVELHECVASWRDVPGNLACKNLFVRSKRSGRMALLILASDRKFNLQEVTTNVFHLDVKKDQLRFASEELLKEKLHVKQGAVNPFAIRHSPADVELWIGNELLDDAVSHWLVHPMTNNATVRVKREDFLRFFAHFGAEIHRL